MVAINSHRGVRYGVAVMICLVLVSAVGGPIITATAATQGHQQSHGQNQTHGPNQGQRHTLVIIHVSGSPSWSIRASGSIQLDKQTTEQSDSIARTAASGSVGGLPWEENASDPKDVIYYTGTLLEFDLGGTGKARVTLDGKRVNPTSLKNTPAHTPTPTPPATPTLSPTTQTPSPTPTTHSPTPPPPTPTQNRTATDAPGASLFDQLIYRYGGVLVLVALGLVTVLYLRTQ
jgi:cell division septation protein DedD